MRNRGPLFLGLCLGGAALRAATAQVPVRPPARQLPALTTQADSLSLTLDDALSRAATQSETVRLARSQVSTAESQVVSAKSAALPQLTANVGYTRTFASPFSVGTISIPDSLQFNPDSTASVQQRLRYLEQHAPTAGLGALGSLFTSLPFFQQNTYTAGLSGSQPLYSGGRVGAGLRIATEYVDAARFTLREELSSIELDVRTAYYHARLSLELQTIARAAVDQAADFLKQEELRQEAGTGSELDVLRAQVSLANLQPPLVQAVNATSLATLDLKRLISMPAAQPVRLTTSLDVPADSVLASAPASDATSVLAARGSVAAEERELAIREQQVTLAKAERLPSVNLQIDYGRLLYPSGILDVVSTGWRTNATAAVSVQIPIFSGYKTNADIAQAELAFEQEELKLSQLKESVQEQYEQARGERETARATIAARQATISQAQRVYDLTVLRYQQGLSTQLEVADARLSLFQARTNLAQSVSDFYTAAASVTRALGLAPSLSSTISEARTP